MTLKGGFYLIGIFGLAVNGFLCFRGGWMPTLLFAAIACFLVAFFLPGNYSTDI